MSPSARTPSRRPINATTVTTTSTTCAKRTRSTRITPSSTVISTHLRAVWMLRYDLNMAGYGMHGLTFMTRYARGWGADYSNANGVYMRQDDNGAPLSGQKRWERDVEARYVVQTGSFRTSLCGCARLQHGRLLSSPTSMRFDSSPSTRSRSCEALRATPLLFVCSLV